MTNRENSGKLSLHEEARLINQLSRDYGMPEMEIAPNGRPITGFMQWVRGKCEKGEFPPDEVREHRIMLHEWGCIGGEDAPYEQCTCYQAS